MTKKPVVSYTHRADVMKSVAIFLVILMHLGSSSIQNDYIRILLGNLASGGVITFFILSGYFFHVADKFHVFIKKKATRFCIPWIIGATLVYALNNIRSINIKGYHVFP